MKTPRYKEGQEVYVRCDGIPVKKHIANVSYPGISFWYRMCDNLGYCEEEIYETHEKALLRLRL